jgi:hypothetical protein
MVTISIKRMLKMKVSRRLLIDTKTTRIRCTLCREFAVLNRVIYIFTFGELTLENFSLPILFLGDIDNSLILINFVA